MEIIADRIRQSRLWSDIRAGIDACEKSCAWFDWCGGGSPCNKIAETGSVISTETMFCRLMRQSLLEVVLGMIEEEMSSGVAQTLSAVDLG